MYVTINMCVCLFVCLCLLTFLMVTRTMPDMGFIPSFCMALLQNHVVYKSTSESTPLSLAAPCCPLENPLPMPH